jgi:hypothetical protein
VKGTRCAQCVLGADMYNAIVAGGDFPDLVPAVVAHPTFMYKYGLPRLPKKAKNTI